MFYDDKSAQFVEQGFTIVLTNAAVVHFPTVIIIFAKRIFTEKCHK